MTTRNAKIGIDVGGTFTDFVLFDGDGGSVIYHKQPSTPDDPSRAVIEGFAAITAQAGIDPASVGVIAHGTTIGLNAVIQRKGARTGLVVSRGSRDILEIGRCKMANPLDFLSRPEAPLVPRINVVETELRLDRNGKSAPIEDAEFSRLVEILKVRELESCAVALTNSYLNPDVEIAFAAELSERLGIEVTASCGIWPEIREYERAMVAVMNAYVAPMMKRYLTRVENGLKEKGFVGRLLITTSNGGTLPLNLASARSVDTLLSGPAAGVVAAARYAGDSASPNVITVDIGGTSSDMSVITGADVEYSNRAHISDFPLFTPVVSVSAIGAGGGSIVHVDEFGVLKVGPESAGAHPGPICYGRGGTRPTLTDCYLVCGFLSAKQRLGGQVSLSLDAARQALAVVADQINFTGENAAEQAAWAAIRVATSKMATELRKGLAERGIDHKNYSLLPFGGAGPVQAALIAEEAQLTRVLIPDSPGTFCAMGAMVSDLKRDFSRTVRQNLGHGLAETLKMIVRHLHGDAEAWLLGERDIVKETTYTFSAAMRYEGQAYELWVPVSGKLLDGTDADWMNAFQDVHKARYGFADPSSPITVQTLQLTARGLLEPVKATDTLGAPVQDNLETRRNMFFGDWHEAQILERYRLQAGELVSSPAVLIQRDTTSIVPPGWQSRLTADGLLELLRVQQ